MSSVWIAGETARTSALPDGTADFDWREAKVRPAPEKDLVALVSRRHGDSATEACLSALSIGTRRNAIWPGTDCSNADAKNADDSD